MLIVVCISYLVDLLAAFLVPDTGTAIHGLLIISSSIGEVWMLGYLLIIGVKVPAQNTPTVRAEKPKPVVAEKLA